MAYFRPCPDCGANLDPGEACGCRSKRAKKETAPLHRERPQAQSTDITILEYFEIVKQREAVSA